MNIYTMSIFSVYNVNQISSSDLSTLQSHKPGEFKQPGGSVKNQENLGSQQIHTALLIKAFLP